MNRSSIAVFLISLALAGCLGRVPQEQRAGDSWRQTAEGLTRPTNTD